MSDWEREVQNQVEKDGIPPLQQQPSITRPGVSRLGSKSRRQQQPPVGNLSDPATATTPSPAAALVRQPQRPVIPEDDDPFAAHSQPQSQQQQPQFVHPLMQEPFRPPQTYAQQQAQMQQQQYSQPQPYPAERDPGMERIQSTLRDSLTRDPSTFSSAQSKQLPPLSRPSVPPLKLGDVINKVLGPRALTNPSAAPANQEVGIQELREKVAKMKLHESINPAAAGTGDPMAGLEADKAEYLDGGATIEYDENDEDDTITDPSLGGGMEDGSMEEKRPLSPGKKTLPTSRLPIDPDDLARRPDELREAPVSREELMHFRRNQANTAGMTQSLGGGAISNVPTTAPTAAAIAGGRPGVRDSLQETFVESKTTGEFIRVRQAPMDDGEAAADRADPSRLNVHNIHEFDAAIDTIIDSVNSIQGNLAAFWLMISGLLVGACLLQVYLVYLKNSDKDFLSFYSVFAGPARKVIYVLLGFSVTLAWWRFSLERHDRDRHIHFITRYHIPNASQWIWMRNLICGGVLSLAFLLTLIMVPLDDYIENSYQTDPIWWTKVTELPEYFRDRITPWYGMAMVRLICVSIGWLCIIHRFGRAEFNYLQLEQEKYERRNTNTNANFTAVQMAGLNRTSRGMAGAGTGMYGNQESGIPTARNSSRVSSSQRVQMQSTNNGPLSASNMAIPPRR